MPIVGSRLVVREAGWSSNSNREDNCGLGDAAHNWLHLPEERRSLDRACVLGQLSDTGAPYGALTTGKSLVVPSCGGKYHAPSIPIDFHWDASRVPA